MKSDFLYMVLAPILTTAISALSVFLIKFIRIKSEELKVKTKDDTYDKYLDDISDIIEQVVLAVSQTYVDTLKSKNAFTEEKQVEAFNKAKSQILLLLTEESKNVIKEVYGDLDSWLDTRIEAEVKIQKKPKSTTPINKLNS